MFVAQFPQAALWKRIVEALKDFVSEANLDCTADGLSMQAMDASHVALVSLLLRADGFERYVCTRPRTLGLSLSALGKVLKCASNDDHLTLEASEHSETLTVTLRGPERVADFELRLMEIDGERLGIPEQTYTSSIALGSTEFRRLITDLGAFGETMTISTAKSGVTFHVVGEVGTGTVALRHTGESVSVDLTQAIQLTFAVRYLAYFTKAATLAEGVTLRLSEDAPLMVDYALDGLGHLRFYLAPKMDDDDS
jgi:proliferating cell nuclear antigen